MTDLSLSFMGEKVNGTIIPRQENLSKKTKGVISPGKLFSKLKINIFSLWSLLSVAVGSLIAGHWSSLTLLVNTWNSWQEYEYGALVPLISGWLVWQRRKLLHIKGTWTGVGIILLGILISFSGRLAVTPAIEQYGFVILIFGLTLSLTGWQAFKNIVGPLMVLLFMVPLPTFLHIALSNNLQLVSSEFGISFLHALHIPAFLDGNIIDLGTHRLQVVEACNGLRYLLPITTISFVCGIMFRGSFWIRTTIVLSAIPLAILMNGFRIGVTGVLVSIWGIGLAKGFLHDFQGWIVYVLCLAFLILEMTLINSLSGNGRSLAETLRFETDQTGSSTGSSPTMILKPALASTALLMFFAIFVHVKDIIATPINRASLSSFPMSIGNWHGQPDMPLSDKILEILRLDDYLVADFSNNESPPINLYIAYYKHQEIGKAIHSPEACLPGSGWTISEQRRIKIHTDTKNLSLQANRAVLTKDGQNLLMYFWFQQAGRSIANPFLSKLYLLKDSITRGRGDSALIRLIIPVANYETIEDNDQQLKIFTNLLIPHLKNYVPD